MNNDDTKEMIMLLPSTVLLKIFYYIDNVADLSRLKCVCQRFWSLIERYSQQLIRIDIYDIKCSQMTINTDDNKHSQYCRITFEIASTKKLNDINGHDLADHNNEHKLRQPAIVNYRRISAFFRHFHLCQSLFLHSIVISDRLLGQLTHVDSRNVDDIRIGCGSRFEYSREMFSLFLHKFMPKHRLRIDGCMLFREHLAIDPVLETIASIGVRNVSIFDQHGDSDDQFFDLFDDHWLNDVAKVRMANRFSLISKSSNVTVSGIMRFIEVLSSGSTYLDLLQHNNSSLQYHNRTCIETCTLSPTIIIDQSSTNCASTTIDIDFGIVPFLMTANELNRIEQIFRNTLSDCTYEWTITGRRVSITVRKSTQLHMRLLFDNHIVQHSTTAV